MSLEKVKQAIAANGGTIRVGHINNRLNVVRCRECLKTTPLRRVQHFYLCEKHYKAWEKAVD